MKKRYSYYIGKNKVERTVSYIPVRYSLAIIFSILEITAIIGIVIALCHYVSYFYLLALITQVAVIIKIASSDEPPEYKVPWLLTVLLLPIAGFMLYFMFYSRKLKRKFIKRLIETEKLRYEKDDADEFSSLKERSPDAAGMARLITKNASAKLFTGTRQEYFPLGEKMKERMLFDLESAKKFIFLEYFIIENGKFWGSILEILKRKANEGVTVRVIYDDIGCMNTLPGGYARRLTRMGIEATSFSRLRGNADSEFNNRSHRKIMVIDGRVGYTGGINLADEYINETQRLGHWKDTGIRLEGEAVWEMTRLFLVDFAMNVKNPVDLPEDAYPSFENSEENGYLIPFGDGPKPIYKRRVGKSVIQSIVNAANEYVYITTPYLIIDNDTCLCLENAAQKGVDVKIILPAIPDKKAVYAITRSFYKRLTDSGVKIYEYTPGFIHAKMYVADGKYAMIGTINLDYRSLVHHFENGVWLYDSPVIEEMKRDIEETLRDSKEVCDNRKKRPLRALFRSVVRIFSPML